MELNFGMFYLFLRLILQTIVLLPHANRAIYCLLKYIDLNKIKIYFFLIGQ